MSIFTTYIVILQELNVMSTFVTLRKNTTIPSERWGCDAIVALFYRRNDGLAMGSSPFLCNLFMITVEETLKKTQLFPRFYQRYVVDIVAIVESNKVDQTLELFNSVLFKKMFIFSFDRGSKLVSSIDMFVLSQR